MLSLEQLRKTIASRRKHRPRSRIERYAASIRPPDGAILAYRRTLRGIVSRLVRDLERELVPTLADLPEPVLHAVRTDSREQARSALARLRDGLLGQDFSAEVQDVAERVATTNAREFRRVFKLDARAIAPGFAPTIDKFRTENVNLIESIQADLLGEVSTIVDAAWTRGARVEDLRKQLQDRFGVTESRADLIARDQVLKLNGKITRARHVAAGVREYIWTTSGDERVRGNPNGKYPDSERDHYRLDGQRFRWDAPPVVSERTGETAHPGEDYQCRCVAMPVLSFLEDPDLDEPL
jgi:SPP1 gp7 family putative phage head morphogenesis protein